ncbi:MAG TPA: DHH family phosphoesterase [Sedimentisphaerales bacterium]|nr:DHH family phosphoesterase [Sedimentisphaerales bacterium]
MRKVNRTKSNLARLTGLLKGKSSLLIVMQDNPDPDAIGAAVALKELANRTAGLSCSLAYGGAIGRAENRELVNYLGLNFRPFTEVKPEQFDLVALLDTQPGTGNNPLPAGMLPHIVIDHHPISKITRRVAFTDIRSRCGATSTLLWQYLCAARVVPDIPTATALLYGILSDTQDIGRDVTQADIEAMEALYPLANKRMLRQIQHGRVPDAYYQMLAAALAGTRTYANCAVCDLGDVDNADMMGEVADLLLRHERLSWTLCYGVYAGRMLLSLRTQDTQRRADEIIRRIVRGIGTGGGHASMAGGQIPLDKRAAPSRTRLGRMVCRRFLQALEVANRRGKSLIRTPTPERTKAKGR